MKRIFILFTLIIGTVPLYARTIEMIDVKEALKAYRFEKGEYKKFSPIVKKLPKKAHKELGHLDGKKYIDNPNEFFTADYFHLIKTSNRKAIQKHIPPGKVGAMKICFLWFRRIAENPKNKKKYEGVIKRILKKSGLKWGRVKGEFDRSIERYIRMTAPKRLKNDLEL